MSIQRILTLAALLAAGAVCAAPNGAPPQYAGDVPAANAQASQPKRTLTPKSPAEGMQLAPTRQDIKNAREANEAEGGKPQSRSRTKIEAVRDPNNRVTEYVVTPGSTKIPYTIENRSDRPIDTTPGGNPSSTLGTPKFIEFGW